MLKLIDERAPFSVRAAAVLMTIAAVFQFTLLFMAIKRWQQHGPDSVGMRRGAILSLATGLLLAWLVARLNGLAYGFTLITTCLAMAVLPIFWLLAGFNPEDRLPLSMAGIFLWGEGLLGIGILVLLLLPASRKAPWSLSNGFTRS